MRVAQDDRLSAQRAFNDGKAVAFAARRRDQRDRAVVNSSQFEFARVFDEKETPAAFRMIPDPFIKRVGFPTFPSNVDEPLLASLRPAGFKDVEREILPLARLENTDLREDREAVPGSGQERFEFGAKFPRAGITVFPDIGSLIEDGQPNGAQPCGQIPADPAH